MKPEKIFKPELLAPAGNLETAVAALSAGADAVYLGMGRFNARNRAENFTADTLARLLDFARARDRKVYVTFNTLVTESELPDAVAALAELAAIGPDALIVQDFGVLALARKYFPELSIHASTQMGIHNSAGVAELARLGVKRVILERQLTGVELRELARTTPLELEVFIHGSLCVSLSGRCLLSAYAEATSGNRGMCKQLCRRNYRAAASVEAGRPKARLSPRDLCGVELIGELARMRVASLKIEGRLRGPDYVVPVVEAYRKALDALPGVSPEAAASLSRTVSRPSSSGTWQGFEGVIAPETPGMFGRRAGVVEAVTRAGVTVRLTDRIHLGDRLRIVSDSGSSMAGFELTRIFRGDQPATAGNAGSTVLLPGHFPNIEPKMRLFKIGENGYDFKRQAAALPAPRNVFELDLALDAEGLHVTAPAFPEFEFHSENFAAAERCATEAAALKSVFESGAPDGWRGKVRHCRIDGNWFCPGSVLKNLRRELWTALAPNLNCLAARPRTGDQAQAAFQRDCQARGAAPVPPLPELNAREVFFIPGFIAEGDLKLWRQKLADAYARKVRTFALGGLHGLALLRELAPAGRDVVLMAVPPWPVANSQAVELLRSLGVAAFMPWVELPAGELELLAAHSSLPELPQPADFELLATRCPIPESALVDRLDRRFTVRYDGQEKLYKLYAAAPAVEKFRAGEHY